MHISKTSLQPDGYDRIFRLLSAAKAEAENMRCRDLARLVDMAMLQTVIDWEGVDPDDISNTRLNELMKSKSRQALQKTRNNVVLIKTDK